MGAETKIEWCDMTFNPWIGCTKISPACDHCYAESWATRFGVVQWDSGERIRTREANWNLPLKWNREAQKAGTRPRVFCASLADVFDNDVPREWRSDLFALIAATPQLDWLLLTKRIGNARRMLPWGMRRFGQELTHEWANVWLGATICNQEEANRDIPKLLDTPAALRFLSIEPMLGPIDLTCIDHVNFSLSADVLCGVDSRGSGWGEDMQPGPTIDWVISGAESGPQARAAHPNWFRSLRVQCKAAGVAFFFKQWGEWIPCEIDNPGDGSLYCTAEDGSQREIHGKPAIFTHPDGTTMARVGKRFAGRRLDGVVHKDFPNSLQKV